VNDDSVNNVMDELELKVNDNSVNNVMDKSELEVKDDSNKLRKSNTIKNTTSKRLRSLWTWWLNTNE
jgi:hypothetical protein